MNWIGIDRDYQHFLKIILGIKSGSENKFDPKLFLLSKISPI